MNSRDFRAETDAIAQTFADWGVNRFLGAIGLNGRSIKQSRGVLVQCPVHGDKGPSCSVQIVQGTIKAHCHACDFRGDAFSLIAAVRGLDSRDFKSVMAEARVLAGMPPTESWAPKRECFEPQEPPALDPDSFDRVARWIVDHCPVDREPDGASYLRSRGLFDLARGLFGCLPTPPKQPDMVRALCTELGAHLWARSGFAHPTKEHCFTFALHRLFIPWRAAGVDGLITNVQRRALTKVDGAKYIAAKGRVFTAPFGAEDFSETDEDCPILLVEGAIDSLAARSLFATYDNPVAALGIPGVKNWREHWALVGKGRRVFLGLDPDEAGEREVPRIAGDFLKAGALEVFRVQPTIGKDWADCLFAQTQCEVAS